ncbi:MAG: hypothetical protein K6E87_04875 [bacterium]|nr:hypothetical protein [bacterium]
MEKNEIITFKAKFHIFMISSLLTLVVVLLLVFTREEEWTSGDIFLCVLLGVYAFTILPAFVRYAYTYRIDEIDGYRWYFYSRWIFLAIMIAPIYGPGFYFKPKREIN